MISNKLYKLAFDFKNLKLWSKLYDAQIFGIELSDGEIAYCTVMGQAKEHYALGIYIGEKGWNSFLKIALANNDSTEAQYQEIFFSQECLQLSFGNKDLLSEDEIAFVKTYAMKNGISLRGKNAWPQFMKYRKTYMPCPVLEKNDVKIFEEVIERILEIEKEIGFANIEIEDFDENFTAPKFSNINKPLSMEKIQLKSFIDDEFHAEFSMPNGLLNKITEAVKKGTLHCEIVLLPKPATETSESVPRCPYMMLAHTNKNTLLPNPLVFDLEKDASDMLNAFAETMCEKKFIPSKIQVRDIRTYKFLEKFCQMTKIKLERREEIPVLDEIYMDLCSQFGVGGALDDFSEDEMVEQMIQMLEILPLSELRTMPPDMLEFTKSFVGTGMLSPKLESKLAKIL